MFDYKHNYCKTQRTSQLFKPEKISTKLKADLYNRDKIQTFNTEWSTRVTDIHHLLLLQQITTNISK